MSSRSVVEIGHDIARSVEMEELPDTDPLQGPMEDRDDDESSIEALQWVDFDDEEMELAKKLAAEEFPETVTQNQVVPSDVEVSEILQGDNMEKSEASSNGSEEDKVSVIVNPAEEEKEGGDNFEFPSDIRDVDIESVGDDGDEEDVEDGDSSMEHDCNYLTADGHGNYVPCFKPSFVFEDKASTAPVLDDGPIWSSGPKMYKFQENRTFNQKLTFGVLIAVVLAIGIGVGNLVAYNEYESDAFKPVEQFQCSGPIQDPRTSSSEETSHGPMHHGFPSSTEIKSNIDVTDNDAHVPKKILETYNRQTETLAYVVQSIDKLSKKFDQFENTTKQLSGIVIMDDEARKYGKGQIDRVKAEDVYVSSSSDVLQTIDAKVSHSVEKVIAERDIPVSNAVASTLDEVKAPKQLTSKPNTPAEVDSKAQPISGKIVEGPSPVASIENARRSASIEPKKLQEDFTFAIPLANKPQKQYPKKPKLRRQHAVDIPDVIQGPILLNGDSFNGREKVPKDKVVVDAKKKDGPEKFKREKTPAKDYKIREASPQREYKPKEKSIQKNHKRRENFPVPEHKQRENSPSRQYKPQEAQRQNRSKDRSPPRDYLPREKSPERAYKPRDNKPQQSRKIKEQTPERDFKLNEKSPVQEGTTNQGAPMTAKPQKVRKDKSKKTKEAVENDAPRYDQARRQEVDERKRQKILKKYEDKENKKYSKYASDGSKYVEKKDVKKDSPEEEFDWHSYRAQTRENRRLNQHWKNEFERNNWQFERDRAREKFRKGGDDPPNNFHKDYNSRTRIR